ncbi:hypothetical protein XELAEV_18032747mg [Xenopus laevis]|uniref:Uncharacterized protein n=1 Tax=Xenopus laevis TaxID=8355 RepID=A0A974CJ09_XENLA|nr:hypothetical protein XELAEV_18032747mg [Xenopus laevis]
MKEYGVRKVCDKPQIYACFVSFCHDPGDSSHSRSGPGREHTFASAARERTQGPVSDNELLMHRSGFMLTSQHKQ